MARAHMEPTQYDFQILVHDGGQSHGRATPKERFVAGPTTDARLQTGKGPDE